MALEELYRDIVESSADGIWVFDLEGRTYYANPILADMFGVSQEEFCRLTVFDSLDELGREQFAEHLVELRAGKFNAEDVECKFVRKDGSSMWVLVGERGIYSADGTLEAVLHRLADYGGRRQTLADLTSSQRQLAEAQRIARIGSWEWDVEADQITASEGLYALYGLSAENFPATYADFMAIVHNDDRVAVHAAVQAARRNGGDFVFHARVQGEHDWVWTRGRGVAQRDETGAVVSMSGTHQDITETKLAELALQDQVTQNTLMQAIASTANEAHTLAEVLAHARGLVLLHDDWERARGFVVKDDDLAPLYVNPGDRESDEATPEITAKELALARRSLEAHTSVWDDERLTIAFPIEFAGSVFAIITITSAPPLYRHEMIQQMVDQVAVQLGRVVERERNERQLAAARDGAMEASRQKSEFLATMSHEIRTPLNGVIGLNDLLLRSRLDSDQQRLASGVQAASRALLGLINDILDFSKIEAGKLELEQVDFEVRQVFDQVATVLGEAARTKGLDLVVSCDPEVPEILSGDPTRLAQVITNLGSNAVKFTDSGEVVIHASATELEGTTALRVEVMDTGIGISREDVDGLFDSFTQADASTTRVHGGTGLGLAISREIVRALQGEVSVESVPGEGSNFSFTAIFAAPTSGAVSPDDDYARGALAGRRALVVDDNERHREFVATQLSWWKIRADTKASADEAEHALDRALAAGDPYDLVVIDRTLALPRRNGLQLARSLRGNPAYDETTLLLFTTTTDLDSEAVRNAGIADILVKPVTNQALRTTMLEHVAGVDPRIPNAGRARTGPGTRPRLLVVEDNAVNQMVAVGLLDALGYDADTADDGQDALEVYDPERYDAVLMDVQMPRLDGYAATRAIRVRERGTGRRVPVLAMTAAAVEGERERCLAAGMDDFLTKPVDPDGLAATLSQWLAGPVRQVRETPEVAEAEEPDGPLDVERLDMLREMSTGDNSYLDRAIGNFVANAPEQIAALRRAVEAQDAASARQTAHKLAGSASNLGIVDVGEAARAIEQVTDSGYTTGAADLLAALERALVTGTDAVLGYQAAYAVGEVDPDTTDTPATNG